eukprot:6669199-Pyramimonas_sp.AAC.2
MRLVPAAGIFLLLDAPAPRTCSASMAASRARVALASSISPSVTPCTTMRCTSRIATWRCPVARTAQSTDESVRAKTLGFAFATR